MGRVEVLGKWWLKGYQDGSRFLVLIVCVSLESLLGFGCSIVGWTERYISSPVLS